MSPNPHASERRRILSAIVAALLSGRTGFDAAFGLDPSRPRYGRLIGSEQPGVVAFLNSPDPVSAEEVRWLAERLECVPKERLRALAAQAAFAYNPDQPREPAGRPGAGRWVGPGVGAPAKRVAAGSPQPQSGPRSFQEFRRLLSPHVRTLRGYIQESVACSPTFYAAVARGLNTIPDDYHEFLALNGRTVLIGDRLVNMDPSLKGRRPQGWPVGSTWAEVSGAYQHHRLRALVAESVADGNGFMHMARDVPATVREEIAHALDRAVDQTPNGEGASSTDPDFVAAYASDTAAVTDPAVRARLHYYLQAGAAGRRELFAQLFVIMGGVGLASIRLEADLRASFPHCLNVLPRILPSGTRGMP